jgi:heme-degrading monooxygenase HmoA
VDNGGSLTAIYEKKNVNLLVNFWMSLEAYKNWKNK